MSDDRLPASCLTCRFFDQSNAAVPAAAHPGELEAAGLGVCRRTPPMPSPDDKGRGTWLLVAETDWCGAGSAGAG